MPYKDLPKLEATKTYKLQIENPAIGGINLKDLEYEQKINQSPRMLNMMYRNGAFSKRYGQEYYNEYENEIYDVITFNEELIVHSGSKIYIDEPNPREIASGIAEKSGLFFIFGQRLYMFCGEKFYNYYYDDDSESSTYGKWVWGEVEPYVPEVLLNCKPDGSHSDAADNFNIVSKKFKIFYHGDGTTKEYKLYSADIMDTEIMPIIEVDTEPVTEFTWDKENQKITFTTAPSSGTNNVEMTFQMKEETLKSDRYRVLNSKYAEAFGGNNNSRIFVAGGGDSRYYYSDAYDASYFPENNFAVLGNSEEDITGFGLQYNVLIVFKPKEIYSLTYYIQSSSTTIIEEEIGLEAFRAQLVNARVGCDAPFSIQLIRNQLTWFHSSHGICCLVSTNIQDERNVSVISRNIERTNRLGIRGLLDYNENLNDIQSIDYNNRYFLVFPSEGICFMWDYEICPYKWSSNNETDSRLLSFFLFDNFYVKKFLKNGKEIFYIHKQQNNKIVKLNEGYNDFGESINAYYQTPLLEFGTVNDLKTVKNVYIQCRGDTASIINMKYITEETPEGEDEPEPIRIGCKLWDNFTWSTFSWYIVRFSNTFRRKCSLKKIQMAGILFSNNDVDRDMSISHLAFDYQVVKPIK